MALVAQDPVPDAVYEQARQHFDDQYSANLTMAVIAINGWNRLAVSLRWPAGNYQPKKAVRS
jgi:alkylhydroperoxidase family enzyme